MIKLKITYNMESLTFDILTRKLKKINLKSIDVISSSGEQNYQYFVGGNRYCHRQHIDRLRLDGLRW